MSARGDWRDGLPDGRDRALLPAIERVQHDSRLVEPGDLFVCVPGLRVDGHDFAAAGVEAGAAALIAERGEAAALRTLGAPWSTCPRRAGALSAIAAAHEGYPSERLTVVGVTGTNGKTRRRCFIQAALEAYGESAGWISTSRTRVALRPPPTRTRNEHTRGHPRCSGCSPTWSTRERVRRGRGDLARRLAPRPARRTSRSTCLLTNLGRTISISTARRGRPRRSYAAVQQPIRRRRRASSGARC